MKRDRVSALIQNRYFIIIFSIVTSIVLWIYVGLAENPDATVFISNIQVDFVGEEVLTENNLIVTNIDNKTLSLKFSGKRNTVSKLSSSNLSATVDLSQIMSITAGVPGVYQLKYTINYPETLEGEFLNIADSEQNYITVTVEKLITKSVSIKGNYDGEVAEGYQVEPMIFDPETITVSGPEAVVSLIDYAEVSLQRDNVSKTIQAEIPVTLIDLNGNKVSTDNLTLSQESVFVTLPVVIVKEVSLTVNIVDGASANAENVICKITPASITLSGDPEILAEINQIVLGTIDLTSFATATTETFQIVIPNDVVNNTGETSATVNIQVIGLSEKKLSATDISLINESEGHNAQIVTQSLDITIRGVEETLDQIYPNNIRVVADLSELGNTTGTFSVPAKIYIDGFNDVDAIGEYNITVVVTEAG